MLTIGMVKWLTQSVFFFFLLFFCVFYSWPCWSLWHCTRCLNVFRKCRISSFKHSVSYIFMHFIILEITVMTKHVRFWTYKTCNSHFPVRDTNLEFPEYKAVVLFTALLYTAVIMKAQHSSCTTQVTENNYLLLQKASVLPYRTKNSSPIHHIRRH
jgi:hypothetical protein